MNHRLARLWHRLFPRHFWYAYDQKARRLGFDKLYLVLSFDCDTDADIQAAERIHSWLREREARGIFAVPGVQLEKGAATFGRMAAEGAEFINHGAAAHTEQRNGVYESVTFYDQMSLDKVEQDIRDGHEILVQVTGKPPQGFRAPHFGHFQKPSQLNWLYGLLRELGYRYASTTVPRFLLKYGPCSDVGGLIEFPVSGTYRKPLNIFDSYGFLVSRQRRQVTAKYQDEFINTLNMLHALGLRGLINHYVDPSHVIEGDGFFTAVKHAQSLGIKSITFTELLDKIPHQA